MVALPGSRNYSRLSIATDYHSSATLLEMLPPTAFYPRPEVSSAMVELVPRAPPFSVNEELFLSVVRALFGHRGKTVKKALLDSRLICNDKKKGRRMIEERLEAASLEKRVFHLSPEELAGITRALAEVIE